MIGARNWVRRDPTPVRNKAGTALERAARLPSPCIRDSRPPVIRQTAKPPSLPPGASPSAFPRFIAPAIPKLSKVPPEGPEWVYEVKYDGYRMQAHLNGGRPLLYTRRGYDWPF